MLDPKFQRLADELKACEQTPGNYGAWLLGNSEDTDRALLEMDRQVVEKYMKLWGKSYGDTWVILQLLTTDTEQIQAEHEANLEKLKASSKSWRKHLTRQRVQLNN